MNAFVLARLHLSHLYVFESVSWCKLVPGELQQLHLLALLLLLLLLPLGFFNRWESDAWPKRWPEAAERA